MQRETLTLSTCQEVESGGSTVRSDVSVASSGYVLVSAPQKERKSILPDYPEEPPPDYDQSPSHTAYNAQKSSTPLLPVVQTPIHASASQVSRSSTGEMVVSISGASPSQNIKIQISPESTNESDVFLYPGGTKEGQKKNTNRKRCTKREKILTVVVLVVLAALALVVVNFTVCVGDFSSACH